jgi:hypothetical protein
VLLFQAPEGEEAGLGLGAELLQAGLELEGVVRQRDVGGEVRFQGGFGGGYRRMGGCGIGEEGGLEGGVGEEGLEILGSGSGRISGVVSRSLGSAGSSRLTICRRGSRGASRSGSEESGFAPRDLAADDIRCRCLHLWIHYDCSPAEAAEAVEGDLVEVVPSPTVSVVELVGWMCRELMAAAVERTSVVDVTSCNEPRMCVFRSLLMQGRGISVYYNQVLTPSHQCSDADAN